GCFHCSVCRTRVDDHALLYGQSLPIQPIQQFQKPWAAVQRRYIQVHLHCRALMSTYSFTWLLCILIPGGPKSWIQMPPDVTKLLSMRTSNAVFRIVMAAFFALAMWLPS